MKTTKVVFNYILLILLILLMGLMGCGQKTIFVWGVSDAIVVFLMFFLSIGCVVAWLGDKMVKANKEGLKRLEQMEAQRRKIIKEELEKINSLRK